jgi:hypothetical protein
MEVKEKILYINSDIVNTPKEYSLLRRYVELSFDEGFSLVRDFRITESGLEYDEFTKEEIRERFKEEDKVL